jgi:GrpB-like predicted nucleotidyltransferase (UPF0157 family)
MTDTVRLEPHNSDWAEQFFLERTRILRVLGETGRGGVAWAVHHVGSTAIPGIHAKPVLDILLEVYPAPLEEEHIAALESLGYEYRGEAGVPGRQFFRTEPRTRHLHAFKLDSPEVHDHLLFRDYLRAHPVEANRYEALKLELAQAFPDDRPAYTNGKAALIGELLGSAHRWWQTEIGFQPMLAVTSIFAEANFEVLVSSGWALEARLGRVHRFHHDVDILVWRDQQQSLRAYLTARGWELNVVVNGQYQPWLEGQPLELPIHQLHAYQSGTMLDVLLAERDETHWQYRRDKSVTRALRDASLDTPLGVRALAPEIVLLFKSSSQSGDPRGKDEQDFERTLPTLNAESRGWLRDALLQTNPEHLWLNRL